MGYNSCVVSLLNFSLILVQISLGNFASACDSLAWVFLLIRSFFCGGAFRDYIETFENDEADLTMVRQRSIL